MLSIALSCWERTRLACIFCRFLPVPAGESPLLYFNGGNHVLEK